MALIEIEMYGYSCDECGDTIVEPAEELSEYDAQEYATEEGYYVEDVGIICRYCFDEFAVCCECNETRRTNDLVWLDCVNEYVCNPDVYADSCVVEVHIRGYKQEMDQEPPFGATCEECDQEFGPSLATTMRVSNPLIQREKEVA